MKSITSKLRFLQNIFLSFSHLYRVHLREYGYNEYNQLRLYLGRRFIFGEGVLYLSFLDDRTNLIVHGKIVKKAEAINSSINGLLLPEEKAKLDKYEIGHSVETKVNFFSQIKPKLNHSISNDLKNTHVGNDYIESESVPVVNKANLNEKSAIKDESDYKNLRKTSDGIKLPTRPAKPKIILPQPSTYDTFNDVVNPPASKFNNQLNRIFYNKLLNTPKKVLEAKRLKETLQANEYYEKVIYQD